MLWSKVTGLDKVESPGLLVDPDRVARNVDRLIEILGGTDHLSRLRPHVKTHKMPDVVRVQLNAGIDKFKTATLAETEMVAAAGASDIVLAHQVVGPKIDGLIALIQRFPRTRVARSIVRR